MTTTSVISPGIQSLRNTIECTGSPIPLDDVLSVVSGEYPDHTLDKTIDSDFLASQGASHRWFTTLWFMGTHVHAGQPCAYKHRKTETNLVGGVHSGVFLCSGWDETKWQSLQVEREKTSHPQDCRMIVCGCVLLLRISQRFCSRKGSARIQAHVVKVAVSDIHDTTCAGEGLRGHNKRKTTTTHQTQPRRHTRHDTNATTTMGALSDVPSCSAEIRTPTEPPPANVYEWVCKLNQVGVQTWISDSSFLNCMHRIVARHARSCTNVPGSTPDVGTHRSIEYAHNLWHWLSERVHAVVHNGTLPAESFVVKMNPLCSHIGCTDRLQPLFLLFYRLWQDLHRAQTKAHALCVWNTLQRL
jgi:hypothetical protein